MALKFFQNSSRIPLPSAPIIEVDELQMVLFHFPAFYLFFQLICSEFSQRILIRISVIRLELQQFRQNLDNNLDKNA